MPDNVVQSPYPLIDADPHFSRVVRYMRPSDYAAWAGATAAFPSALYFWGIEFQLCLVVHSPKALPQRWLTLQRHVCGLLYASVACLASLAASYLRTSGQAVSLRVVCIMVVMLTLEVPSKSASGDGQRISARRRGT